MGKLINLQEMKRQYEAEPARFCDQFVENLDNGTYRFENISFRDLFEAMARDRSGNLCGRDLLYECSYRRSGGHRTALQEAANAVSTGDMSNIIGQIVYNRIREKYQDPSLLWPRLVTVQNTEFLNGERIPSLGRIGDRTQVVAEGAAYPYVGLNEEWTDTRPTVKHGFIVPLTREVFIADRTGLVSRYADEGAMWCGVTTEKEVIDTATGQTNSYNRNGVSTNTFLTSGAYINDQTSNALDGSANEWRALEKADLLFDAMTDPNTGEPIGIPQKPQMLVPSALSRTADRIKTATGIETVDMRAQATTVRTQSGNPMAGRLPEILTNQYVKARTSSTSKWFYGDFQRAILWMSVWGIETASAAPGHPDEFGRDIWAQHKCSYRGVSQMYEPRFLTRNDT